MNIKHYRAIGGFALMLFLTGCIAVSHRLVNPSLKPVDNLASKGVKFYVKNFKLTSTYMNDFMWRDFNSEGKSLLTSKYPTLFSFSDKDAVELEIHIAHNRTEELKPIHNMLALLNGTVILPFVKKYNHAFSVEAVIGTSATGYERAEYRFFTRQLAAQNIIPFWMFCYPFAEQDGSFYHDFYGKNILSNKEFTDAVLQVLTEFSPETLAAIRTGLPIRSESRFPPPATATDCKSPPAMAPQSGTNTAVTLDAVFAKPIQDFEKIKKDLGWGSGTITAEDAFIPKNASDDDLFAIILDANYIYPPSLFTRPGDRYKYADQKASDAASKLVAAMQKMTGKNVELVLMQVNEQGVRFSKTTIPNDTLKENIVISVKFNPASANEYDLVGECMKILASEALSDNIRKKASSFFESRDKPKTAGVDASEQSAPPITNQQNTTISSTPDSTPSMTPQKRSPTKEIIAVTSMGFDRKTGEGASLVGLTVDLGNMGIRNKTGKSGWNGVNTTGIYTNMSGEVQTLTLKDVSFWVNGDGTNWWDFEIGEVVDSKGESVLAECISTKDEKGDGRIALMVDRCYRLVPCGNTLNSIHFVQPSLPADRLTHIFKKLWPYFTLSFQGSEMVKPAEDTQIENVKAWLSDGFKPNDWKVTGFFVPDKDSSPSEQHRLVGSSCGYVVPISDTLKGISLIEYCQVNNYNKLTELFKSASSPAETTMQRSHSGTAQQSAGEAKQSVNQEQDGKSDRSVLKPSLKADESGGCG